MIAGGATVISRDWTRERRARRSAMRIRSLTPALLFSIGCDTTLSLHRPPTDQELARVNEVIAGEKVHLVLAGPGCSSLAEEYAQLIWDDRSAKREEHPGCSNHLTDATLYAWRYCYAYLSEAPPPRPKPGSKEWYDQEAKEMEEAEVQRYLELQAERREAEEWGFGWQDPRPEPIS